MRPKLLFQELWAREKDWDETLDDDIKNQWNMWKEELRSLENIEIPRCLLPKNRGITNIEIRGFGDASLEACGAVVYER